MYKRRIVFYVDELTRRQLTVSINGVDFFYMRANDDNDLRTARPANRRARHY